jgi:hypothetical protein
MPKQDLYFSKPLMNATGMLGFAPNFRDSLPWNEFGAFVTNPISFRLQATRKWSNTREESSCTAVYPTRALNPR